MIKGHTSISTKNDTMENKNQVFKKQYKKSKKKILILIMGYDL